MKKIAGLQTPKLRTFYWSIRVFHFLKLRVCDALIRVFFFFCTIYVFIKA